MSKLIYRLYGENFVCSSPEKNEWYYFNGIRWKKENKSYNLRVLIINEVFTKIEKYRRQLIREGASEEIIKNYHNILQSSWGICGFRNSFDFCIFMVSQS